jgi:hypothetical protein
VQNRRDVIFGILAGALTGTAVGLLGFFLAESPATNGMGGVMFLLVPFCSGFAIAQVTSRPDIKIAAGWVAVLASLSFLLTFRYEGLLCAVLALPWLAVGLSVGALLGHLFQKHIVRRFFHQGLSTMVVFGLFPLLILSGKGLEQPTLMSARREIVSDTVLLPAAQGLVWTRIQSIDSIDSPKPFLMHIGLPVPLRCTLERAAIGAKRTCYFENGFIEETITAWDPPRSMRLVIDRTNMPGRHWLGFEDAEYKLEPEGNSTRLTRTTTITSHLYPVWYWRYFEGWE